MSAPKVTPETLNASFLDKRLPSRFWDKASPCPMSGCWIWTAAVNREGYAMFRLEGSAQLGHRVSFVALRGAIPAGLQLDHLCRVRCCVNPAHLEPVTNEVNAARGWRPVRTHCPNGHPFDEQNTYLRPNGSGRMCKTCVADSQRRRANTREWR